MRALVVTVVHHPDDSRIRYREINALLDAGWQVTYAAPFSGYGLFDNTPELSTLEYIDLPRAAGRRRFKALRAARKLLKKHAREYDVVLLHDPELLFTLPRLKLQNVVWDVHEDTAAAVTLKPWLPGWLRPIVRWGFQRIERLAERRLNLILAEYAYQERFQSDHLVVPNVTTVPDQVPQPDEPRVVYSGTITRARGAEEMIKAARVIAGHTSGTVRVELFGRPTPDVEPLLRQAVDDDVLDWRGFVPNDQVMKRVEGAIAGFSLLHDEQNYRVSLPTKVTDYIAHGVPVVTTPLPAARDVVEEGECGIVVPFDDPHAAANAVLDLWDDPERRLQMGTGGHRLAQEKYNWTDHAAAFVKEMEGVAQHASTPA